MEFKTLVTWNLWFVVGSTPEHNGGVNPCFRPSNKSFFFFFFKIYPSKQKTDLLLVKMFEKYITPCPDKKLQSYN